MALNFSFSTGFLFNVKTILNPVIGMETRVKARYENEVLKPLEKLDLKEGEDVGIVIAGSLAKEFRDTLKLENAELIAEIAESDELL